MKKEKLIEVYQDTVNRIENGEYEKNLESYSCQLIDLKDRLETEPIKNVQVINNGCIEEARRLSLLGQTCMLNMASYKKPGGGVKNGAMAQEEELSRRSNLVYGLPIEFYPLEETQFLYTKDVTFFKDSNYNIVEPFKCDIITMAAINLNRGKDTADIIPINYQQITEQKILNLLMTPSSIKCKNLVLSAFGCGVFKNKPDYIASVFLKYLPSVSHLYDNIVFAILNDKNSVGSNYEIFNNIISNGIE